MNFDTPLVAGRLIQRYKRFLADVELDDGSVVTAHCPNTGAMTGCREPGSRVWLSRSDNPRRKLRFTWELVDTGGGVLACVNTSRPNHQVRQAIERGVVTELQGYASIRSEVRYGQEKSRIDLHLSGHASKPDAWVEVKNVTLSEAGQGFFPDAVSKRGQKHLRELAEQARQGDRAVLFFCVNHAGIDRVSPADHIDPDYGKLLREAARDGVEIVAWKAELSPESLALTTSVPVVL